MPRIHLDTALRIINLNPFFSVHVDSTFTYALQINKSPNEYFWYLKNSPVGLRLNKDNGLLTFKADKAYFLSGRLKYDLNYKVSVGVQNLSNPEEKIDTSFSITFYNTEIIRSKVKPTVNDSIWMDEGETISFKVICESGSFPIDHLMTLTNVPINNFTMVQDCGQEFKWTAPYEFVKETDPGKMKSVTVSFIGTTKFNIKDTAKVKLYIKDALNYPLAVEEYNQAVKNLNRYVLQLKFTFLQLDKRLRRTKSARTTFDLTSATTSLTGTIMSTASTDEAKRTGKILPSVGLALVPIKEAAVPNKSVDQNQAGLIRASIKRLEYIGRDYVLIGEHDPEITKKTIKLREELKQVQVQLIEVPIELTNDFTEEELNQYFNSPKVNKKYRLKTK
ncbi:MAG TPA: hypothetical protein VM888_14250 [Chitinophagaceae bacterium]|nr:hypothetical protein [Chitinophagaceae bacterium]